MLTELIANSFLLHKRCPTRAGATRLPETAKAGDG